ncbi:Kinesin-like protein [Zostera marina]|uniref:Kinesin-like protein n=1 Tax=Zostera marina TaxID=29655 RepID=A0A0K9P6I6_ZOSMR|nr:Kinesin-like protein [Zostera marina]
MEKISVAIRFRPFRSQESIFSDRYWRIEDNRSISLHRPLGTPVSGVSFAFDHVFDHTFTNEMVYSMLIKSIIDAAVHGFNGTAFAYGQTSSGKTFTMNGSENELGIIQLAVRDVFNNVEMIKDREFLIRVSYMEIYNEEINDLLSLGSERLPIHESLERGIYVSGLREDIVNCSDQVLQLIKLGEANRRFGETNMNARSSRSHTIFRMIIESSLKEQGSSDDISDADAIRVSVLNLVDLAGSERISKTGAGGVRLKEGKYINKSLMILGNVINKLSESGKQRGHIPYRDSKLTRILQPALGGNAKTSIICTVAPEEDHIEESRGTLLFASRAKRITNYAQVNEVLTDAALLKRQKLEIEELRRKLHEGSNSEVLEQVILKQRNDMLKSESEREKLVIELEEERKSREVLEQRIREQELMISELNGLPLPDCDETSIQTSEGFKTPGYKTIPSDYVARRTTYSSKFESSPFPIISGNIADEDLWLQLNNGHTTDINMLQMTPGLKSQSLHPHDISIKKQSVTLEIEKCQCAENISHLEAEKASLIQAHLKSKEEVQILSSEKEQLVNELENEKQKFLDLRKELKQFVDAFFKHETKLVSIYTKSKAMVDNLKTCKSGYSIDHL